ncbi:hypothetical protein L249_5553, partial [Ophiocordyceps polyrhachis-furcata BCC 54312]
AITSPVLLTNDGSITPSRGEWLNRRDTKKTYKKKCTALSDGMSDTFILQDTALAVLRISYHAAGSSELHYRNLDDNGQITKWMFRNQSRGSGFLGNMARIRMQLLLLIAWQSLRLLPKIVKLQVKGFEKRNPPLDLVKSRSLR